MCVPGQRPAAPPIAPSTVPSTAAEALAGLEASLGFLAAADVADWPADALAGCLRALGRAESAQLAARSRVLSAFNACGGFEADGQPTIRTWLRWQTQITTAASYGATGWMRRLAVHPRVTAALGAAQVTSSFARLICDWSDLLPPWLRDEADEILLAAAAGGASQADLAMLAQEMLERSAPPDSDGDSGPGADDDGFKDRRVWLDIHFRGAGHELVRAADLRLVGPAPGRAPRRGRRDPARRGGGRGDAGGPGHAGPGDAGAVRAARQRRGQRAGRR